MTAFASTDDLGAFWRPLVSGAEADRGASLLGFAATLIRAEFPDIDDRIGLGNLDEDLPRLVSMRMVKRVMAVGSDREGVSNQQFGAGPFQTSATYANPMGDLYLTDADKRLLSTSGPSRKAFSINLTASDAATGLPYWDAQA